VSVYNLGIAVVHSPVFCVQYTVKQANTHHKLLLPELKINNKHMQETNNTRWKIESSPANSCGKATKHNRVTSKLCHRAIEIDGIE
jgi:hypothetical protein